MTLVLDAGALIAYERGNRKIEMYVEWAERTRIGVRTTTGVVAQVWRDSARQARLGRLLRSVDEVELTRRQARQVGKLLANSGGSDVVDGTIIDVAFDGDEILTSDPDDIKTLAGAADKTVLVTPV